MLNELRNFFKEEEGGADQLIVAAVMVMGGIAAAIFFGNEIMDTIKNYIDKFKKPDIEFTDPSND